MNAKLNIYNAEFDVNGNKLGLKCNQNTNFNIKNISKFKLDILTLKHAIDFIKHFKNDTVTINGKEYLTWKKLLRSRVIKTKVNY